MKSRILTIIASLLMGCASVPLAPPQDLNPICQFTGPGVSEPSGLVKSSRYPGVFWAHNDSGDSARIFAVTSDCRLLKEFIVEGAESKDWEDITSDGAGNLYAGDIGNNWNKRRDLTVYRIPEPDPYGEENSVHVDLVLPFRYANQKVFSPLWQWNFDAESLFWMDGAPHILTKNRSNRKSQLYRLPLPPELYSLPITPEGVALDPVDNLELYFSLAGNATGADLHPNGQVLAVLTYRAIYLFGRATSAEETFVALRRIKLNLCHTGQAESIAWDGDDLIFGNEVQRQLFRIPNALDLALGINP